MKKNTPGWFHYEKLIDHALTLVPQGNILELGCFLGRSTRYIYEKIEDRNYTLTSIDPFSEIICTYTYVKDNIDYSTPEPTLKDPGGYLVYENGLFNEQIFRNPLTCLDGDYSLVDFNKSFHENFLAINSDLSPQIFSLLKGPFKQFAPDLKPHHYDLLLVDSSHSFKETLATIKSALPLLAPGGVIAGDDYNWIGTRMALECFFESSRVEVLKCDRQFCQDPENAHGFWLVRT